MKCAIVECAIMKCAIVDNYVLYSGMYYSQRYYKIDIKKWVTYQEMGDITGNGRRSRP